MKFYQKPTSEILSELKTTATGLSSKEALRRLKLDGPNQISVSGEPLWRKILAPFMSVMIGVLILAAVISFWHGEHIDAVIIFVIIMISAVIDWVQQWSTERILRSLRRRENEAVEVSRDGNVTTIAAENLVCGDIIILHEGQKVPADARIIESDNLHADESMLTGESLSVKKQSNELRGQKEVYEQSNMVFSGSFAVSGAGVAVVTAVGNDTEFGRLAKLAGAAGANSPVQKKVDDLVKKLIIAVFVLAVVAFALQMYRGIEPAEALRFIMAFAVSAVPEGLPIAITVILALGMKRMADKKALVRNMRAIENIGLVTTIATDKTGTLTRNELRVQDFWSPRFNEAAFALQTSFSLNASKGKVSDPLDIALSIYLARKKVKSPDDSTAAEILKSLPFDYEYSMSGNIWKFARSCELYIKGAPEKVLSSCNLTESNLQSAEAKLHELTSLGFRVIAFAKGKVDENFSKLANLSTQKLEFIGFAAIADELRPRVAAAIQEATQAGVRVRMITGDHSETAFHIAKQINIADDSSQIYDCRHLLKLSKVALAEVIEGTRVYARVIPEAKHKILTELNRTEITAMTGDGVNDVPALSQAHVGISMGAGAAIAKDASDIVLLDNNFRSIVTAIREGRIIIANIRRMLVYLIATNAGEVLTMLGALIIGMPLPVVAVQILWINLATDTFMVIPLGLEPGDKNIMKKQPADPNAPILTKYMLSRILVIALTMATITLTVFGLFLNWHSEAEARSAAFLVLIVIQWINAISMRGEKSIARLFRIRNRPFFIALASAVILQILVMFTPLRVILHLESIHIDAIWACLVGAGLMLLVLETHKYVGRRISRRNPDFE